MRDRLVRLLGPSGASAADRKRLHCDLSSETLEPRWMFSAEVRSYDGTDNNVQHPQWGSSEEAFVRISPAEYLDGIASPAGQDRPNARVISNSIVAQGDQDLLNDRDLSAFIYAWGQFLDHDIDLTNTASPKESLPISIPTGDPHFDPFGTGLKTISLSRSNYDIASGTSADNPRQQVNSISAFIDGSQVYGSTADRAAALRTFQGGKLKTSSGNLLPFNTLGLDNQFPMGADPTAFFVAGDVRANENVELTAMHTLFLREHNRIAESIRLRRPSWDDERIYQAARRFVSAEMQAITYNEFLPAILGVQALAPYRGYQPDVNPGIANEFAAAAFRFGHSMLGADVEFLNNSGQEVHPELALRDAFFAPGVIQDQGIATILKYLASDRAQEVDTHIVDDLRNFLFGPPGSGGLDLAALNIQRGRDHGLADYNTVRAAYGLQPVSDFAQITSNLEMQQALATTYASVDEIDLWVGGLAEDHVLGSSFGPLFQTIIKSQFERLRDGDRFWYENDFHGAQLKYLREMTLAKVIRNNTETWNLQPNVFEFRVEVSGRVMADRNSNGRIEPFEQGLAGLTVQLQDTAGQVIHSVVTDRNGSYRFVGLELETYRVRVVVPQGLRLTTNMPADISMTRGMVVEHVNFGLSSVDRRTTPEEPNCSTPGFDEVRDQRVSDLQPNALFRL